MSDPTTPPKTPTPTTPTPPADPEKITVMMKAIGGGDTPIMKKSKWAVEQAKTIAELTIFTRKYLNLGEATNLFFYVNDSFVPHPDHTVGNLFRCFAKGATQLVLQYSVSPTYG